MQSNKDFRRGYRREVNQRGLIRSGGRGIEGRRFKIEKTFPKKLSHFRGVVSKVPIREVKRADLILVLPMVPRSKVPKVSVQISKKILKKGMLSIP